MDFEEVYKRHNKRYKVGDIVLIKEIREHCNKDTTIEKSYKYTGKEGEIVKVLNRDGFSYKVHFEEDSLFDKYVDDRDIYKKYRK